MADLITVVTPTWHRDASVLRAVLSVALQEYRPIQHVVVADGPNPELRSLFKASSKAFLYSDYELEYAELPAHHDNSRWGHFARLEGIRRAKGDFVAYLDDDDEYLPNHLSALMAMLKQDPQAGFSYSRIMIYDPGNPNISGTDPPTYSGISTSAIAHRKAILERVNWRDEGQDTIDWDIAQRWMAHGITWKHYPHVTCQAYRDAPNPDSPRQRILE
jgi:glycosyltransferase involved in cell wall biosynthesis